MKVLKRKETYEKKGKDGKSELFTTWGFYLDFENGVKVKIHPVFPKTDLKVLHLLAVDYEKQENNN